MKYLIVVAHPDDEVLGCGASIYKWTIEGSGDGEMMEDVRWLM